MFCALVIFFAFLKKKKKKDFVSKGDIILRQMQSIPDLLSWGGSGDLQNKNEKVIAHIAVGFA